jgi:hypothetical protein
MKRPKPKEAKAEVECPACEGTGFPTVEQPAQPASQNLSTALQAMLWERTRASIIYALSGCRHSRELDADRYLDKLSPGIVAGRKNAFLTNER